jgi:hypothetical protein
MTISPFLLSLAQVAAAGLALAAMMIVVQRQRKLAKVAARTTAPRSRR